ncbi:MAG: M15 family metallopeptidase [Firmicutes bacterium]|nr:M15 family metallopeptidase [Bacillota bacterium]
MKCNEIQLDQHHMHRGNLILVNGNLPLLQPEIPHLMPMDGSKQSQEQTVFLESTVAALLLSIFRSLRSTESIVPVSGYRSFLHQRRIYEDSLRTSGVDFTMKYVALPGCSEHQTGLAVDLGLDQEMLDYICPDFPRSGICEEFRHKAPAYGFIERYKAEKTPITGIAAEPWHFRYVGYPHSVIMEDHHFSLEEYIQFLRQFPYEGDHFHVKATEVHGAVSTGRNPLKSPTVTPENFEIFFVKLTGDNQEMRPASITLPSNKIYQISGNNDDGCIVTVWN